MSKSRFFTGIQATGKLTLGNYCGLIHHILKIQEDYEVIIMIADLHSLTVPKKDFDYQSKVFEMVALLYACGLNENCRIYVQSSVSGHSELMNLLSPHVTVGKLGDMIQYKDKVEGTGNLALLSYPVLMAADIFLYAEKKKLVFSSVKLGIFFGVFTISSISLNSNERRASETFYWQRLFRL